MSERIQKQTKEFETHSIGRLLLRYSIPATVGTMMFSVHNIVDRIFIGKALGSAAIAGIGITFPIFMISITIGMMIGIGGGTLASLRLGNRHYDEAEEILGNMFTLFVIGGIALGGCGLYFLEPLMRLFGASDVTYPYARDYMSILYWFMMFDFLAMGTNNILRAEGSPKFSMWNMVVGCIANIVLDYIFIFPMGLGIKGAAWATGIAKVISTVMMLWHFTLDRHRVLTLRPRYFRLNFKIIPSIFAIGLSPFIMQFVNSVVNALTNRSLLKYGGDEAVGAMTAIYSILMFLMMPVMGLMMGYQPIVGYNYGAKLYQRTAKTIETVLLSASIIAIAGLLPIMFFADNMIAVFCNNDRKMIEIGAHGIKIFLLLLPLGVVQGLGANFFQATGRPKISIALNLFRNLVCLIPLLLILPQYFQLNGIWMAMPTTDLIAATLTMTIVYFELKKLKSQENCAIPVQESVTQLDSSLQAQ